MERHERLFAIGARVNRQRHLTLLVDSGASLTAIARRVARRLGLNLRRPLRRVEIVTADRVSRVPVVSLQSVQVGRTRADNLEVLVINLPSSAGVDGLLGMNFFEAAGVKRITFELDTETLVLRKPVKRKPKRKA